MDRFAGVDCHPGSHTIAVIDAQGLLLAETTIPATPDGYRDALATSDRLGCVIWGLEGTGTYGRPFADYLVARGAIVYEVPGAVTKRYRKHSTRPGKSDAIDAKAIAEALLSERERLPRCFGSTNLEALRVLYDHRDRLVRERTQAVNRLRSAAMRLELLNVPADLTSARKLISFKIAVAKRRGEGALVDAFIQQALHAVDAIEFYATRIADIEKRLRQLVKPFKELLRLHGISYVVAAGLVGHAGDIRNCRSADSFAMRSAVAPVPCSSGRNEQVRLNLGGNRQLNRLLHVIAVTQISHRESTGRSYYERKMSEGKTPRAALRSLKRRLATVVYYRLREDLNTMERGVSGTRAA